MCPIYLAFVAVIVLIIILLTCTCSDSPDVIYISGFKEHKEKREATNHSSFNGSNQMMQHSGFNSANQMIPYSESMNDRSKFSDPILSTKPSNDSNTLRGNMIKLTAFEDRHNRSNFLTGFDTDKSDQAAGFIGRRSNFLTGFDVDKSDQAAGFTGRRSNFLTGFDTDKSDQASGFISGSSSKLVNGVNYLPTEFGNPNDYYNFGTGGSDLDYM